MKIKLIFIIIVISFIYIITWIPMEVLEEFTLFLYGGKSDEFTLLFLIFFLLILILS